MADIKQPRTSVIQLNPAYLLQTPDEVGSSVTAESQDVVPGMAHLTTSADTHSDSENEIVNVDESDDMETETTDAERLQHELRTQNPGTEFGNETASNTADKHDQDENTRNLVSSNCDLKRRSPKQRFEPYRKEIDENDNRTCKPYKNRALLSVVEEIKKQAALTAQKPAHIASQPFLQNQVCKLVLSSKTNGKSAPNAVIQLNKNNNRNDDQSSDEGQHRPFKCHFCNIGFRISGHLSRHYKSRSHIMKMNRQQDMHFNDVTDKKTKYDQKEPIDLSIGSVTKKVEKTAFKAQPGIKTQNSNLRPSLPESVGLSLPALKKDLDQAMCSPLEKPVTAPAAASIMNAGVKPSNKLEVDSEVTENGSRRFRCDICDIGFRFQGHLDRHMRSTTHTSMEEAVKRTGRRPVAAE